MPRKFSVVLMERESSLTPTEKMRPSIAPTEKMSYRKSSKSSISSEKRASKSKSSMKLFNVKEEDSLTLKSLNKLLKNLGIDTKKDKNVKKSFGDSFENLAKKGFKTK